MTLGRRNVERTRQVIDHRVDEVLHALVFEGGASGHRNEAVRDGLAADGGFEVLFADRLFLEEHHADFLIEVGHLRDEVVVSFLGQLFVVVRYVRHFVGRTHHVVVGVEDGLLIDHVDLAAEIILPAERDENGPDVGPEFDPHGFDGRIEIRSGTVHLVDEGDAWDVVFGCLAPDSFGLRLHPGNPAKHGDGAVEHAKRAFHLGGEIHVARRVDDVDPHVDAVVKLENIRLHLLQPCTGGSGRSDGDTTLAFLLHPIGHRGALVHLADFVDHAGVKKNALGQGGFAGVDVRADANVACPLERKGAVGRIGIRGSNGCGGSGGHTKEQWRRFTSGSGQRRGWLGPFCAFRRAS